MTLKYYHAEPAANSVKSMIPLIEKSLPYQSVYVDLHKFEQPRDPPWRTARSGFSEADKVEKQLAQTA